MMPFVIACILVLLAEGTGHSFLKIFHIKRSGFASPIGAAILFSLLEILYLPRLCLGGPFGWIKGSTFLVLIFAIVCVLSNLKGIVSSIVRGRIIYVLLAGSMMFGLFYI